MTVPDALQRGRVVRSGRLSRGRRIYELLEKHDAKNQNFLVVGPWDHGGWGSGRGNRLGRVSFESDTGAYFRKEIQAPFFARYLRDKDVPAPPEARVFQTGANKWESFDSWPPKEAAPRKLYFRPKGKA